jgi:hypothetical protein
MGRANFRARLDAALVVARQRWWLWLALIGMGCLGWALRAWLFGLVFEYRTESVIHDRPLFSDKANARAQATQDELIAALGAHSPPTIQQLVDLAAERTARRLSYRWSGGSIDPDVAWQRRRTNCIGYAAVFGAELNHLLQASSNASDYQARHVRGSVAFFGVTFNIHLLGIELKNHDFNVVMQQRDGQWQPRYYVDAGTYDTIGVLYVRGRD